MPLALLLALGRPGEHVERLVRPEHVGQVAEVDQIDDFPGREVGEQLPERLSLALRVEVPHRVEDRPDRHVHDALFRAEPAQLAVVHEAARQGAHVGERLVDSQPAEQRLDRADGLGGDLVAAPDREDEAVARRTGIGPGHDVGRRVVRIGVHRVGSGEFTRRREADVGDLQAGEALSHRTSAGADRTGARRAPGGRRAATAGG